MPAKVSKVVTRADRTRTANEVYKSEFIIDPKERVVSGLSDLEMSQAKGGQSEEFI